MLLSQQEVFIKTKWGRLIANDAVMVLMSPKEIVLLQMRLAAGHAHMVGNVFLVRLYILQQRFHFARSVNNYDVSAKRI